MKEKIKDGRGAHKTIKSIILGKKIREYVDKIPGLTMTEYCKRLKICPQTFKKHTKIMK